MTNTPILSLVKLRKKTTGIIWLSTVRLFTGVISPIYVFENGKIRKCKA